MQKKIIMYRSKKIDQVNFAEENLSDDNWQKKKFECDEKVVRIGTVFSGIGAIEHAFQRLKLKHKIVFAGDIDINCKKSYFANYDITEDNWFTDIRDFDAKKYKNKVDFVIGGAPCQAFSMVGKRLGFEDARGTLFYEFARFVKETQPKLFLFENVKGLLNHENGIREVYVNLKAKSDDKKLKSLFKIMTTVDDVDEETFPVLSKKKEEINDLYIGGDKNMAGLDLIMYKDGLKIGRAEGIEQGIEQGIERGLLQGKLDILVEMVKDKTLSVEDAAKRIGLSEKEFLKYVK